MINLIYTLKVLIQLTKGVVPMIQRNILLIMVFVPIFLLLGCAPVNELSEFNFPETQDTRYENRPYNRARLAAYLACSLDDIDAQVWGLEGVWEYRYILVSCPDKGLKDVQCMQDLGFHACLDRDGNLQNSYQKNTFKY